MKKTFKIILLIAVLLISIISYADEGDTIFVQTIDFDTPVNPGWNAPREGIYEFPPQDVSYQKALIYYTLKCDNTQSPACGEWDYLTHTFLYEHTGVYDSTLYFHPNFIANGQTPDTLAYMNSISWFYHPKWEYSNQTSPTGSFTFGQGNEQSIFPPEINTSDGKAIFIWTADELNDQGVSPGEITGLQIHTQNAGTVFHDFEIRMAHSNVGELNHQNIPLENFVTVYKKNSYEIENSDWQHFSFAFPFLWNGTSNVVVEFTYDEFTGNQALVSVDEMSLNLSAQSVGQDYVLEFENYDLVEIPVASMNEINEEITITCWIYGSEKQPQNDNLFEAVDADGNRVLNVHLPWSDSKVYWDAGWEDGGYDRISRQATAPDFKGKWNHWAFTKNTTTGIMRIYLNGEFFMIGGSKNNPMTGINKFHLGSMANIGSTDRFYDGKIDEFRIWKKELSEETIKDWMHRHVDETHPEYENLIAYYMDNSISTPYLNWQLAQKHFGQIERYSILTAIYDNIEADPPEVIVDEENIIADLFEQMPILAEKYKNTGGSIFYFYQNPLKTSN